MLSIHFTFRNFLLLKKVSICPLKKPFTKFSEIFNYCSFAKYCTNYLWPSFSKVTAKPACLPTKPVTGYADKTATISGMWTAGYERNPHSSYRHRLHTVTNVVTNLRSVDASLQCGADKEASSLHRYGRRPPPPALEEWPHPPCLRVLL